MKPRSKVPTLAVGDLGRALAFHRDGLGLPTQGITGQQFEDEAVVSFRLDGDLVLAPCPAAALAKDAGVVATGQRLGAGSIGHAVGSKAEVDAVNGR